MPFRRIREVVIIGAGNMATNLGMALFANDISISGVYNRSPEAGQRLAEKIDSAYFDDIHAITKEADLYILAVADSAIQPLAELMRLGDKLVVHTSGTVAMEILGTVSENIGVFYPLQTFSPGRMTAFKDIPVCIESNSAAGRTRLESLAHTLTDKVFYLDSDQRKYLHLSAVIASNFTNFLYVVAEDILRSHQIPFELLGPLVARTAQNIGTGNAFRYQTGPALRGDLQVMACQRDLLKEHPDYLEIYNLISDNIIKLKSSYGKL